MTDIQKLIIRTVGTDGRTREEPALRASEVRELLGISERTFFEMYKQTGAFPKPSRYVNGCIFGWKKSVVDQWIQAQKRVVSTKKVKRGIKNV